MWSFVFPPKCIGLQLWHFQWLNCNHSSVFVWSSWQSFCSPATRLLDTNPWPIWDVVGCMAKYFNLPITITILPCICLCCLLLWGHQSLPPHSLNCLHCQFQEASLEEMGLLGNKSTSFKLNPTPLAQYMTHCRSYQKNSQQTSNFPPLTWRDELTCHQPWSHLEMGSSVKGHERKEDQVTGITGNPSAWTPPGTGHHPIPMYTNHL